MRGDIYKEMNKQTSNMSCDEKYYKDKGGLGDRSDWGRWYFNTRYFPYITETYQSNDRLPYTDRYTGPMK